MERFSEKIKEKYQNQREKRGAIKKASKKAINWMKKTNYLQTDDDKIVDYNNDTELDELSTVGYNSKADVTTTPKISTVQQQAKKIIKKYKNLKRKRQPIVYTKNNKKSKDGDVIFIKKVTLHPRERLVRETK